jgi:alpha-tubulin suppressor-like RCC1 family protein
MSLTSRRLCTSIVVIGSLFAALIMPNTPAVADSNEAIAGFQAPASKITAGDNHTCAVENDGDVYCWGQNNHGQFGNGTTISTSTPSKVLFPDAAAPVTAITGSAYHTCAVLTDGTVYCWGYNGNGQLGNGTTTANATPALATLPSAAATITAGNSHT